MKRQIRRGVFETNSSSVHSLTLCTADEYEKWENGELWFDSWHRKFVNPFNPKDRYKETIESNPNYTEDDIIYECLREDGIYQSSDEYFENEYYETYKEDYITPGGERVVAFGYYGHDC